MHIHIHIHTCTHINEIISKHMCVYIYTHIAAFSHKHMTFSFGAQIAVRHILEAYPEAYPPNHTPRQTSGHPLYDIDPCASTYTYAYSYTHAYIFAHAYAYMYVYIHINKGIPHRSTADRHWACLGMRCESGFSEKLDEYWFGLCTAPLTERVFRHPVSQDMTSACIMES